MRLLKNYPLFLFLMFVAMPVVAKGKHAVGWIEYVKVFPGELEFKAKLDTGAYNSSIHAENIVEFDRDGELWVRFDIINRKNISATLELPVVKEVTIKRHFGKKQKRYAVMLGICVNKTYKKTQVSLVDREGFLYALLIGRSYLKKDFMIDPAEQFTSKPQCQVATDE